MHVAEPKAQQVLQVQVEACVVAAGNAAMEQDSGTDGKGGELLGALDEADGNGNALAVGGVAPAVGMKADDNGNAPAADLDVAVGIKAAPDVGMQVSQTPAGLSGTNGNADADRAACGGHHVKDAD